MAYKLYDDEENQPTQPAGVSNDLPSPDDQQQQQEDQTPSQPSTPQAQQPSQTPSDPIENVNSLEDVVDAAGRDFHIPVGIRKGLINRESGGNPNAVSVTGAKGVMQLTEGTAKEMGVDRNDPVQNIYGGMKYLRKNYDYWKNQKGVTDDTDAWAMAVRGYLNGTEAAGQNKSDGTGTGSDTNDYEKNIMSTWLNHLSSGQPDVDWQDNTLDNTKAAATGQKSPQAAEQQQPVKLDLPTQAPKTTTSFDDFTQKTIPATPYTDLVTQRYQNGQPVVTNSSPTELKTAYAGYLALTRSQDSPVRQAHFAEFMPIESMYLRDRGGQLNKNDVNQALISQAISYATRKNVSLADTGNIQSTLTKEQIAAITDPNTPLDGVLDPNTGQRLTAEDVEQVLGGHISPLLDQRRNNENQYLQLSGDNLAEALKEKEFQFAANARNVTQSGQEYQDWLNTTARKVEVNLSDVTDDKADIGRTLFRRAAKQALPQVSDSAIDYVADKIANEHGGVVSAVGSNPASGSATLAQLRSNGTLSDSGDNKTTTYDLHMNTVRDLLDAQQDINEGRQPGQIKLNNGDDTRTLAYYYVTHDIANPGAEDTAIGRPLSRVAVNAVNAVDTIGQLAGTLGLKLYRGVTTGSPDLTRDDQLSLDNYERRANRDFDRVKLSIPSEDYGGGEQQTEQAYQSAAAALGDKTPAKQKVVDNSKQILGVNARKAISGAVEGTANLPVFMLYGIAPPLAMAWRVGEHGREDISKVGEAISQDVRDYLLFGTTGRATHAITEKVVGGLENPIARQVVGRVVGGGLEGGVFAGVHAGQTAAQGRPVNADDIWQAVGTGFIMHQLSPRGELNDARIAARKTTTFEGNPYYTVVDGKREYFALANFETEVPTGEEGQTETHKGKMYVTLEADHPYIQKNMGNMEYVTPDVADRVRALSKLSPTVPISIKQDVLSSAAKYLEARGNVEGWWNEEAKNADTSQEHDETVPTATDIEGRGVLTEGEAIRRATYETHGVNYDAEERIKQQVEDLLKQRNEDLKAVEGHSNAEKLTNLIYDTYDEQVSNLARQLRDASINKPLPEISETTGDVIEKPNPKIAAMTDDEITARVQELTQKPKKGTSVTKRQAIEDELNQLRDEAARRFTRTSFVQQENKPVPEGQTTFKDFVENEQPQGGVKFSSLTPEDPLYKKLKAEYDEKYPSQEVLTSPEVKTSVENYSPAAESNKISEEQEKLHSQIGSKLDSGVEFHYRDFTKPDEQAAVGRLLSEGRAEVLPDGTIRSTKPETNTEAAKNIRQNALEANREVFSGYSKVPEMQNTFTKEELSSGDIQHIVNNGAFSLVSGYDNLKNIDRTPEMKRELESKGYTVLDADGMYKGKSEPSLFVIHNGEEDPTELNAISAKYNQQQAMHGVGGYYTAPYTGGENAGKTENFGRTVKNDIPADTEAYTSVKLPGGGRHNFTVTDLYDNERPVTPKISFDYKGQRYTASSPDDVTKLQEVETKIKDAKDELRKITKASPGSSTEQDAAKTLHQLLGSRVGIRKEIAERAAKGNDSTVQRQQGGQGLQGVQQRGQTTEQMPVQQGGSAEASSPSGNVQVNGQAKEGNPQLHVRVINSSSAPRPVARETTNSYVLDNGDVVSKNKAEVTYKPVDVIGKKQASRVYTPELRPSKIKADDGSEIDLTDRRWSNDNKYVHMETRGRHGYVNERAMNFLMVGARDGEMPTHRTFGVTFSTPEAYQMIDRIRSGVGMLSNPKLRNEAEDLANWLEYHTDQQLENDPDAKGVTALTVTPYTRQEQIDVTGSHEQIHVDTFKEQGSRRTLFDDDTSRQLEKSEGFGVLREALKQDDNPYRNAPTDELASEVLAFGLTNDHETMGVSKNVLDEALLDVIEHLDKTRGEDSVYQVSRAAMRDVQELLNVVQNRARNKETVSSRPDFGEDLLTNVEGTDSDRYRESEYSSGGEQTRWAKTYEDHLREITPEQLSERRKQLGFWKDNPGNGEWLAANRDTVTAGYDNANVKTFRLKYLPGFMGEHQGRPYDLRTADVEQYAKDMKAGNWDWEKSGAIHVVVDADGKAVIYEGNRRMRAAVQAGLERVPVDVTYKGGSEDTAKFDPARMSLIDEASRDSYGVLFHATNQDGDVLTVKRLTKSGNPFEVTNMGGRERQTRETDKAPVVWNFFIKDKSDDQYHLENDFKGGNWKEYETTIRPRLYDFHTDALNLRNESSGVWMPQLISAGYHGFWNSNPDASPTFRNRLAMFDTPESREMLMTGKKIGLLSQSNEDLPNAYSHFVGGDNLDVMSPDELESEFKDSKVRDENGNLLKTYHATPNNFQNFDLVGSDIGIHFGTKEQAAERIKEKGFENSRTIPAYLNIKNPLRVEDVGEFDSSESVFEAIKDTKVLNESEKFKIRKLIEDAYDADGEEAWKVINKNINGELRKILLSKGYDGLVYRNDFEGHNGEDSYIAFNPKQIKSALSPSRRLGYLQASPDEAVINGKHISDWTPEDWKDFGDAHGVDNLGMLSPLQTIKTVNVERERNLFNPTGEVNIQVPGGLDGQFTYYDLLYLKANPIPVNELDEETHAALMKKLTRTLQPPAEDKDNIHLFNQYVFGMTSPGTGLTTNQFAWSQLRASTPEDIAQLASYSDDIQNRINNGEEAKTARLAVKHQMESDYNLGKQSEGGLGLIGNYDVTSIAELAAKFRDGHGSWYKKRPNESWADLAERVSSATRGLGTKVAMFTTVWQAPHEAATAAIDLHMSRRWRKEILGDDYDEAQATAVDKWNKEFPKDKVESLEDILNKPKGTVWFTDNVMISYLGAKQANLVAKDGSKNPNISEALQNTDWPGEAPQKVQMISDAYHRGLDKANEEADRLGLSAFEAQWMFWDKQRGRLEPHEIMFPGLSNLPKPSVEQMRAAREAHSNAGYFASRPNKDIEMTVTSSSSHLGYFQLDNSSKDGMESVHPEFVERNRRTVGEQLARDAFFRPEDIQNGNEETTPETAAATELTKGFDSVLSSAKKPLTPEEEQHIVEAYQTNGINKLQKMFGRTDRTIKKILTNKGVALRERPSNIPEVSQSLDAETKGDILRLYIERQMSYRDIANELGLEASGVGRVITDAGIARSNSEAVSLATKNSANEFFTGKRVKYTSKTGQTFGSDSSYELAFMNHLDNYGDNVESWNRDVPIIPYNEGNNRYVPDFVVNFKDGNKALIEIKPFSKLNDADVIAKADAARQWAEQNGMTYHVITERELGEHAFTSIDLDRLNISDEEKEGLRKTLQSATRKARAAQQQPRDFNSIGLFHAAPKKTFDEAKLNAADESEWLDLAVAHSKNGVLSASEAKNISDLAQKGDVEGLQNFVAGLNHQSVLAMIANARRAGLISGVKTLAKVSSASGLFQSLEEGSRLMASSVDLLLSKALGKERTVQGVSPRGIYNGVTNAITEGIPRSLKILKYGEPAFNLEDTRLSREASTGYIWAKPIEAFSNYVIRSHGALASMIKTYAYHRAAYEVAALKAKANGTDVRQELANLTPQESDQSWRAAEVAAFMNDNPVNTAYQRFRGNRSEVTKFLLDMRLPIVKVPTNIVARALDYTGLSELYNAVESDTTREVGKGLRNRSYTEVRDALAKAIDTPDVRRQIAFGLSKSMLGWTLGVVGWHLAKAGLLYGFARPEDKNRRNVQELENSGDGNIKLGNRWYNISSYSPVATMLLAGASFYEDAKAQSREEENGHEAKTNTFTSVLLNILKESPYVSTASDFLTNDNKQTSTLASIGNLLGINTDLPASFVPAIVGNVATTIDSKKREVAAKDISTEIWNKIEAKIPGLREKLPEHKNIFGESEAQPSGIDPFASRKANTSPLTEEMKSIGFGFGIRQKEGESLEDLRERRSTEGVGIRERLEKLIQSPYYGGSEKERREAMSAVEKFVMREEKANKFSPDEEQHNLDVIAWREANKKALVDILANGGYKDIKSEDRERYASNVVDKTFVSKNQKLGMAERQFENLRNNPEEFMHKVYLHRKNRSKGDGSDEATENKANILSEIGEGVQEN